MRKIITSVDIGSDSVKLIVGEYFENRLHVLCASKVRNKGIERGKVVNAKEATAACLKAKEEAEAFLGLSIDKCILGLNMVNARLKKCTSTIRIKNDLHTITGDDINEVMLKCAEGNIPVDYVLVSIIPIEFVLDNNKVVDKPIGLSSDTLHLDAIIVCSPKSYVSDMLDVANQAGLKVMDVVPNAVGDYYAYKNNSLDEKVGAIVNLGSESTTVSLFNKGIITNTNVFPVGGSNIIGDISYLAKIDYVEASAIYRDIVLASGRLANPNEYRIVPDLDGEEIKINQYDISEVASCRIDEILNLAKKEINILTKKEISYIIILGGLSELRDFNLSVEKVFGKRAKIGKLNTIGVRDNSYSSAIGIIKYFVLKLELRGKGLSMVHEDELEVLNRQENDNLNSDSLLGKVFGYFFDN